MYETWVKFSEHAVLYISFNQQSAQCFMCMTFVQVHVVSDTVPSSYPRTTKPFQPSFLSRHHSCETKKKKGFLKQKTNKQKKKTGFLLLIHTTIESLSKGREMTLTCSNTRSGGRTWCYIVATISTLWWYSKGRNRGCKLQGPLHGVSLDRCIAFD